MKKEIEEVVDKKSITVETIEKNANVRCIEWKNIKGKSLFYVRIKHPISGVEADINVGESTFKQVMEAIN